jgi:hypothetical protein
VKSLRISKCKGTNSFSLSREQSKDKPDWIISKKLNYKSIQNELSIGGIYVRVYNENEKYLKFEGCGEEFLQSLIKELLEPHSEVIQYSILFAMVKYLNLKPKSASNSSFLQCSATLFEFVKL